MRGIYGRAATGRVLVGADRTGLGWQRTDCTGCDWHSATDRPVLLALESGSDPLVAVYGQRVVAAPARAAGQLETAGGTGGAEHLFLQHPAVPGCAEHLNDQSYSGRHRAAGGGILLVRPAAAPVAEPAAHQRIPVGPGRPAAGVVRWPAWPSAAAGVQPRRPDHGSGGAVLGAVFGAAAALRSEERRVGKECRCGWSTGH